MRITLLVLVAVGIGVLVGLGRAVAVVGASVARQVVSAPQGFHPTSTVEVPKPPRGTPMPRAEFDREDFDFGTIESGSKVRRAFVVTNTGKAPLTLEAGGTSCGKCTIPQIPQEPIPPGQKAEVVIEYHASTSERTFRQHAILMTNDPLRSEVTLSITGSVAYSLVALPEQVTLTRILTSEQRQAEFKLLAYLSDKFEVLELSFLEPSTAKFFEASHKRLTAQELQVAGAKSGATVMVTIKPGLPLGLFRQTIRVRTNLPEKSSVEIPVQGLVENDMLVIGEGWDGRGGVLVLGAVHSSEGLRRDLQLVLRGEIPKDVQVTVGKADPAWLGAELGKPVADGPRRALVPLTIVVPRGSPPVSRLGNEQTRSAFIYLHTNVPGSKDVRLRVRFAVEP